MSFYNLESLSDARFTVHLHTRFHRLQNMILIIYSTDRFRCVVLIVPLVKQVRYISCTVYNQFHKSQPIRWIMLNLSDQSQRPRPSPQVTLNPIFKNQLHKSRTRNSTTPNQPHVSYSTPPIKTKSTIH